MSVEVVQTQETQSRSSAFDSNTVQRLITAVKWIPTVGFLCFTQYFTVFIVFVVCGGLYEYILLAPRIAHRVFASEEEADALKLEPVPPKQQLRTADIVLMSCGVALTLTAFINDWRHFGAITSFSSLLLSSVQLWTLSNPFKNLASSKLRTRELLECFLNLFGFFIIAWPLAHAALIQRLPVRFIRDV